MRRLCFEHLLGTDKSCGTLGNTLRQCADKVLQVRLRTAENAGSGLLSHLMRYAV